jgi:hypothetical protein
VIWVVVFAAMVVLNYVAFTWMVLSAIAYASCGHRGRTAACAVAAVWNLAVGVYIAWPL